jgi:hypothetical protein
MATVDQLIIEIKAETAQLRRQLGQVNKSLGTTEKRSAKVGSALKAAFAGVGAAVIGRTITNAGSAVLDTTRKFEDLRATLQANTGSLKETEDAFAMILEFTAGTTFQIDQVTRAFIEFRRIGIKPTEADLRGIGNVAAAQGVSIDEIAQAIFRGGTTSIEQLQSLGFTAKTEGDKMQISFKDTTREIDKSVESVMKFVREIGETEFADGIEQRANTLTGALSNLGDATEVFKNSIGDAGFKTETIALVRTLTDITNDSESAAVALGETFGDAVKTVHGAVILLNEALGTSNDELDEVADKPSILDRVIGTGTMMMPSFFALLKKAFQDLRDVADESALDNFNVLGGKAPTLKEGQTVKDLLLESMGGGKKDGTSGSNTADEVNDLSEAFKKLEPVITEATNKFTNDFVQSLMDGENAMESFKNLFKDMARQIIASALQMQVIKPIMDAMFTAVGLPVSAKAGGGRVQKGMPTLVGERGAEIFVPNTGGTIMNNMNTKNALSGGGGVTVVQNNNFALGVGATARAEVAKLLPQIQESSKAAVLEAAARGGSFRRGLMGG